jgi:hypothetical protein
VKREKAVRKDSYDTAVLDDYVPVPRVLGSSPQQTKDREMSSSPPSRLFRTAATFPHGRRQKRPDATGSGGVPRGVSSSFPTPSPFPTGLPGLSGTACSRRSASNLGTSPPTVRGFFIIERPPRLVVFGEAGAKISRGLIPSLYKKSRCTVSVIFIRIFFWITADN